MILDEPLLEPVARFLRFEKGVKYLKTNKPVTIVDLGCGPLAPFLSYAAKKGIRIKRYFGIDPLLSQKILMLFFKHKTIRLMKSKINKIIPFPSSSADYVVSFATLEHFDFPREILNDSIRVLKKGGKIILTTPSPQSKSLLELLTKLGLISQREVNEHKQYLKKLSLLSLISKENLKKIHINHAYFHPWKNNLLVIEKLRTT